MLAEHYPRDDNGWILFPRDTELRRKLQPAEVMEHPAKMNMHLLIEIVKEFTRPGDTITDIFGGVGTTAVAILMGRNVNLIEIETHFTDLQNQMRAGWVDQEQDLRQLVSKKIDGYTGDTGNLLVINGDNQRVTYPPTDHMIFSPPYANDLAKLGGGALTAQTQKSADLYTHSRENLGRKNEFFYRQAMGKVYDKVGQSVRAGGTVTITHRDRSRAGRRITFANSIIRELTSRGFSVLDLNKWKAPGTIAQRINAEKGALVINDEDVLTFIKDE